MIGGVLGADFNHILCLTDDVISAFLESKLSASDRADVEQHLDACESCRKLMGMVAMSQPPLAQQGHGGLDIFEVVREVSWEPPAQIDEYRLLHPIGQGQMGQVYEAHDEQLDRRVALKLLRRKSDPDSPSRERLRLEARAIARLDHPSVVRVFRSGVFDGQPYIVSEFVVGQSLDRIVKPLPWQEVRRIGLGLAKGLDAAHQAGVLHRDIKPANAMLADNGAVKLLDFGLAKLMSPLHGETGPQPLAALPADALASLTRTGGLVGTPRYMAPEVWRGESATPLSDIYSLGCVLYEMGTGRFPFPETALNELRVAVLTNAPTSLMELVPSFEPSLAALVMRCLERDPTQRPRNTGELCLALERIQTDEKLARWRFKRTETVSFLILLIIMVGAAMALRSRNFSSPVLVAGKANPPVVRRSVAIIGFQNTTGKSDNQWLVNALSEMMRTELASSGDIRVISSEQVYQLKNDLALPETSSLSADTLRKIRNYLDVDLVVSGSFSLRDAEIEQGVRLDYRLFDTGSGLPVYESSETIENRGYFNLVLRAGKKIREQIGVPASSTQAQHAALASIPDSPLALKNYIDGIEAFRGMEYQTATEKLVSASKMSPLNPTIQMALANVYAVTGYTEKQREAARRAQSLSAPLGNEDRIRIEVAYSRSIQNFSHAIDLARTLSEQHPDNLELRLELAEIQVSGGAARDAIATIDRIRHDFPSPIRDDPRINLTAEWAYRDLSELPLALAEAKEAQKKGFDRGSSYIVGKAQISEGWSYYQSGEYSKAESVLTDAASRLVKTNQLVDVSWAMIGVANSNLRMGRLSKAISVYRAQISSLRKHGIYNSLYFALLAASSAELSLGNSIESQALTEEALQLAREYHYKSLEFGALSQLSAIYMSTGRMAESFRLIADIRSMQNFDKLGERGQGMLLTTEGRARYLSGDINDGERRLREAIAKLDSVKDAYRAMCVRIVLAELLLDGGDSERAESLVLESIQTAQAQKAFDVESQARILLASILQTRGDREGSLRQLASVSTYASASENLKTRLMYLSVLAKNQAASRRHADLKTWRRTLQRAQMEAERANYIPEQFMIRRLLGQILLEHRGRKDARMLLEQQALQARSLGFGFFERKAQDLLSQ